MPSSSFPAADPWWSPAQDVPVAVPAPQGPRPLGARVVAGRAAAFASLVVVSTDPFVEGAVTAWVREHVNRHLVVQPALPALILVMSFVLPHVSYRRRDALMVLVPVWGLWIVGLAFYRLTGLPFRDWRPRPDERRSLATVEGLPRYYVLTRQPASR